MSDTQDCRSTTKLLYQHSPTAEKTAETAEPVTTPAPEEEAGAATATATEVKSATPAAEVVESVLKPTAPSAEVAAVTAEEAAATAEKADPVSPAAGVTELSVPPSPRVVLRRANWPSGIIHLRENYNPTGLTFAYASHYGDCGCETSCRAHTCRNALLGLFCKGLCCLYGRTCGNSLPAFPMVAIASRSDTLGRTLVAIRTIEEGVIIGENLGEMKAIHPSPAERGASGGYVLMMSERAEQIPHQRVAIDAKRMGSLMRFMNHSRAPVARFAGVSNGRKHTMVIVSTQRIAQGQEITVDYGRELWFRCHCGQASCVHTVEEESKQAE